MEKLDVSKFKTLAISQAIHIQAGEPCGTSYTSSAGSGRDYYHDNNENGTLDRGDTVMLDDGRQLEY